MPNGNVSSNPKSSNAGQPDSSEIQKPIDERIYLPATTLQTVHTHCRSCHADGVVVQAFRLRDLEPDLRYCLCVPTRESV